MTPYYRDDLITLYHGDARSIMPHLIGESIITDPVWPNAIPQLAGADDPIGLFRDVAQHFPQAALRAVIQLGCDSDPRFLSAIPAEMKFFRACWLEYVAPHYKGRLLYTSDVAYVYGIPPASKEGARVLPGRMIQSDAASIRKIPHPCPRQLQHVEWLVGWFGGESVIDPFAGSGTTLLACKRKGIRCTGVEIEEKYCEAAANRLQQEVLCF